MELPRAVTQIDQDAFDKILSVPWLKNCVKSTGQKWGRGLVDCKVSRIPQNLACQVLLIDDKTSVQPCYQTDEILLVIYRWDRHEHLGWPEPFPLVLTFPDGSQYEVEVPSSTRLLDGHSYRVPIAPTTTVREKEYQTNRVIPRVVWNLSAPITKQPSQLVRRLLENIRRLNFAMQCTAMYVIVEDEACVREIETSGIENFMSAYQALRSGSFRADLMRYYLLYKYGGFYLDDKSVLRYSIDSSVFDSWLGGDGARNCDLLAGDLHGDASPEIAFIGSRPGSPVFLKALKIAIDNIMRRDYTDSPFCVTGNCVLGKAMKAEDANHIEVSDLTDTGITWATTPEREMGAMIPLHSTHESILVAKKDEAPDLLWQRQPIPRADWPASSSYYRTLWTQRTLFIDENETPGLQNWFSVTKDNASAAIAAGLGGFLIFVAIICYIYPPIEWHGRVRVHA